MRILNISDTHGLHSQWESVNENELGGYVGIDMVIHSGDISDLGKFKETEAFLKWYHAIPVKHKLMILGNHELGLQGNEDWLREQIQESYPSITYLHHETITLEGFKIFGSPYTPYFGGWAYNVNRDDLEYYWEEIESDTDIIITHGPPLGIRDLATRAQEHTGCRHLLNRVLDVNPLLHQFGHIHECHGYGKVQDCDITFVNASCVKWKDGSNRVIPGIKVTELKPRLRDVDAFGLK